MNKKWVAAAQIAKVRQPVGDIGMTELAMLSSALLEALDHIATLEGKTSKAYSGPIKTQVFTGSDAYSPGIHIECPTLGTTSFEGKTLAECAAALASAYEKATDMKLFYYRPDGHGPRSWFVFAETAQDAADAVNRHARDPKHDWTDYDRDHKDRFDAADFMSADIGEVITNAND